MKKLTVGIVQQSCTADRNANIEKSAAGIRKAVSKGAELIVLQEFTSALFLPDRGPRML